MLVPVHATTNCIGRGLCKLQEWQPKNKDGTQEEWYSFWLNLSDNDKQVCRS